MSIVQVVAKNLSTGGATQTTSAISTTPGNVLAFCAAYNAGNAGAVTPSDSTGLTWVLTPNSPHTGSATGLSLSVWIAQNITGNAANTFTFATTGTDTPTIFIAEFSGRDKTNPVRLTVTASDATASSGAHSTGSIPANSHDDLLAFTVSSSLAQSYTAGGSWAIPPNGTITSATGYDAFVQYQNNVALGAVANTYSVTVSDKLDAFILSLQIPAQPYSDEFGDWFNEVPEVFPVTNSYQTQDVQPQIADVDQDWLAEAAENDAWIGIEDQSAPVTINVAPTNVTQYFGTEAETLDEALDFIPSTGGYQQKDVAQQIDDFLDWDEDPDDFFADDFGNDDADLPVADAWDHWPTDDDDYVVIDDFLNITNPGPLPITVEDPWDPQFFGEEPDQIDGTTTDLDPVGPDNNPVITAADGWETAFDDGADLTDDTWWIELAGDYPYVNVNVVTTINVEDAYDHFAQDPDDETFLGLDTDATYSNTEKLAEDAFDWYPNDEDDYVVPEDYQQPPDILAIGDDTDWAQDSDDDQFLTQNTDAVIPVPPQSPEDAWPHELQDADDELYFVLNTEPVIPVPPQSPEDPTDWTQDSDDEEWITRNSDPVGPSAPQVFDTDWDFNSDDADDQLGFQNEQLSANLIIPPSQATDFAWDFSTDDEVFDEWTDFGEITPIGFDRFGYCLVEAVSQTGIQGARSAFMGNAACMVIASYFDSDGLPFVPNVIQYRVDDVESETNLVPWTELPLSTLSNVLITADENRMISFTRPFEVHQVLFQITDRAGDINYARVKFDIIRVTGA